jgi:N-methylhydantoinase A
MLANERREKMGFTVDIDTGGTFTDGLFIKGTEIKRVKVDTTPHDITIAWLNAMEAGAAAFGFSTLIDFLEQVDIVRWSNTTASNILAEKKGPKLGIFVTEGYQESLYSGVKRSPVFGHLLEKENVEIVNFPLDGNTLVVQLKQLLEKGVRRICISLKDGFKNLQNEMDIKALFEDQYPDHYLGNVPFLLAGDICKHPDDMNRTHMALMNSYVHGPMARAMFKAEDELRERGYLKPLLLGHTDGGVARVAKTKPVDTIESGPIFGIHAGAFWAEQYHLPNVITLDVGGTTTKIGLVVNFRPAMVREADILGIPLKQNMLDLRSIALGGGTVARVVNGKLTLGPDSMGAYPGPACYDLGGTLPTLTDAYLVKGFLDPDYFAGGSKRLHRERAQAVIMEQVAGPMRAEPEMVAYQIATRATRMIADEVSALIKRMGKPKEDYVLFAFGGNGALVGCEVARKSEIDTVYVFGLGSVLSAFGSSVADISHTYEYSPFLSAGEPNPLIKIVGRMMADARRDMAGEGFAVDGVEAELYIELHDRGMSYPLTCEWTIQALDTVQIATLFNERITPRIPQSGDGDLMVEILRLRAKARVSKMKPYELPLGKEDASGALKGERDIYRGTEKVRSRLYDWEQLQPGNRIEGHAILEGRDSTYIVPRNWVLSMDAYRNGVLSRR